MLSYDGGTAGMGGAAGDVMTCTTLWLTLLMVGVIDKATSWAGLLVSESLSAGVTERLMSSSHCPDVTPPPAEDTMTATGRSDVTSSLPLSADVTTVPGRSDVTSSLPLSVRISASVGTDVMLVLSFTDATVVLNVLIQMKIIHIVVLDVMEVTLVCGRYDARVR